MTTYRTARLALGLSQRELAARARVSQTIVTRLENGTRVTADYRRKVARALAPHLGEYIETGDRRYAYGICGRCWATSGRSAPLYYAWRDRCRPASTVRCPECLEALRRVSVWRLVPTGETREVRL